MRRQARQFENSNISERNKDSRANRFASSRQKLFSVLAQNNGRSKVRYYTASAMC